MELTMRDGARLDAAQLGRGEPLVLVHGSASDQRTWDSQVGALSERFAVLAYSRRFHWPNEPIADGVPYAMEQHVADLAEVVEHTGRAHVVGHSYGALVALGLAVQRPDAVRSLVLVEPPALPLFASQPPRPLELLRLLLTRPATAFALAKFGATGMDPAVRAMRRGDAEAALSIFGRAVLGPDAFGRLSSERLEQSRINTIPAEFLGPALGELRAAQMASVDIPTLLVGGERSPRVFRRFADRLEELLEDVSRAEISDASHIVHEDDPAAFRRVVVGFLTELAMDPKRRTRRSATRSAAQ